YNKTEDLVPGSPEIQSYTHLMIGTPTTDTSALAFYASTHTVLAKISAFDRMKLAKSFPFVQLEFSDKIHILKRLT
ncbi:unnamed protein product, partial [Candidula unifasciata]